MSAIKFKVGDKVKVRKGLVADEYYDMHCASAMTRLGGEILTIRRVESDGYYVGENTFCWTDEMLEPVEKTLDNLCAGDFVKSNSGTRKILAAVDGCYLLSYIENHDTAHTWFTAIGLGRFGYRPVEAEVSEPTIEIDGKKYKKADVDRAIKDVEPIE